jgi:PAS domain S-box-containing protein
LIPDTGEVSLIVTATPLPASLVETLDAFDGPNRGTPLATSEVAARLDVGRRGAYDRLERLVARDRLRTKKVGARGRVWWRPVRPQSDSGEGTGVGRVAAADALVEAVDRAEVGVVVLDEEFEVVWVNEAIERYFGTERERAVGRDARELVERRIAPTVDDSAAFLETVLAAYDDDACAERFDCRVTAGEGREERWLEYRSRPIETGRYAGGRIELYSDVTRPPEQARRIERQRDDLRGELDDVFERVQGGFLGLDADLRITYLNDRAEGLLGRTESALLGARVGEVLEPSSVGLDVYREVLETRESRTFEEYYRPLEAWFESRVYPSETGLSVYFRDVTERTAHERELARYETIVETVGDGVYAVDEEGRFILANDALCELTGWERDDLVGRHATTIHDEEVTPRAVRLASEVAAGERDSATVELEIETKDGDRIPAETRLRPFPLGERYGRCGVVRDVTERARFEETLTALYDSARKLLAAETREEVTSVVVETVTEVLDLSGVVVYRYDGEADRLHPAASSGDSGFVRGEYPALAPDESSLAGAAYATGASRLFDDVTEHPNARIDATEMRAGVFAPTGAHGVLVAGSRTPGEFDDRTHRLVDLLAANAEAAYDRVEHERRLRESERRYRAVVDNFPNGAVALFDENLRCLTIGGELFERLEFSADELEGDLLSEHLPTALLADVEPNYRAVLDGETTEFEVELGGQVRHFRAHPVTDENGEVYAGLGMSQDVTERKARERQLEEYRRWNETLVENVPSGAVALVDRNFRYVTFGGTAEGDETLSRSDLEGAPVRDALPAQIADVVVPAYEAALDGEASEFVDAIDGRVYQFHFVPVRDDEGDVFAATAMSQEITDRVERERKLERQRERLAALDDLNGVFRDITDAVIEQSTREEIERTVCERLAASDSYLFAWIGDVDVATRTVNLRTEAGVEGYLDGITISADPDDERSGGLTGTAVLTREMQISRDAHLDPRHDPWREHVEAHGVRSLASIPIVHEETLYGVLNVYAARPNAFSDDERAVVGQLGEVVGHAISAVDRKRALMSDEVVELEFQISDALAAVGVPVSVDGTVAFERTVPVGDGVFFEYGSAEGSAMDALRTVVESDSVPHWKSVTVLGTDDGTARFQLTMTEPPVVSAVTSHGGHVREARIEDGDYYMRIHLPPTANVRSVVDAVRDGYPTIRLLTQRQVGRDRRSAAPLGGAVLDGLTDRQRTALELAYFSGFFEWPRQRTGEDVAASIGVTSPTFHQHLRRAQKKLLAALFDDSPA